MKKFEICKNYPEVTQTQLIAWLELTHEISNL